MSNAASSLTQPAPPANSLRQLRFECTCGWKLLVVPDIDEQSPSVPCGACGGIAVRRSTEVAP